MPLCTRALDLVPFLYKGACMSTPEAASKSAATSTQVDGLDSGPLPGSQAVWAKYVHSAVARAGPAENSLPTSLPSSSEA